MEGEFQDFVKLYNEQVGNIDITYREWLLSMIRAGKDDQYIVEYVRKFGMDRLVPRDHRRGEERGGTKDEAPPISGEGGKDGDVPPISAVANGKVAYELTLTSPDDDPYYLRSSLEKIVKSAMFDVVYWQACIELTKEGMPHIHAILWTKRAYLDASKIKHKSMFRYRYELKRVRDLKAYLNYIKKENGNDIIVDYCKRKGIPQFWNGV